MKLEVANYVCSYCRHIYSAPSLDETAYGEFLLWSEHGEVAYLNVFNDTTYKEVSNLIKTNPKIANLMPLDQAKVLRKVYGKLACDRDELGGVFSINFAPMCPVCRNHQVVSKEFFNPPNIVEIDVQPVTHNNWFNLADEDKYLLCDLELANI